jgi:hypothetical protein
MQGVNARRALLKIVQIGTIHALLRGKYYYIPPSTNIPGCEDEELPETDSDDNVCCTQTLTF